jgi:hypothetical protein
MLGGCFPQINGKRYQYNVNDIEQPKGNQDWTMQRHRKHWSQNEDNQNKTHNTEN